MRKKYIGIALPENLIKEMDKFVKDQTWGYLSRAELAKDAIRQLMIYLKKK
jgi:metal-responsive CopG/Arc/MetJ family transcriptional regulator